MIDTIFYFPSSIQEYEENKNNINPRTISFIPPGENEDFGIICKDNVRYGSNNEKMVDEEDITEENNVIKFKDREASSKTNPYGGMGKVILRKNMVYGVNTLTQDMFCKTENDRLVPNTNTIYVIRYDYILGENITIPENCVLEFDGGSINGEYILFGNKTIVKEFENSGNALWSGEFVTKNGRHVSNHYKVEQKNNIHLSCPWGYYGTDKNMNDRMIFQRMLGYDYYHFTLKLDVNVDGNGFPTSLIWRSKDLSVTYNNVFEIAADMANCIDSNKLGVFDGIKVHTENTNIDVILGGDDADKIIAFLNLYKEGITRLLSELGNRCLLVKNFFIINEEPMLMSIASNNTTIYNLLVDIKNIVKSYCINTKVSISACKKDHTGFATKSLVYTPQMISLVDVCGVNFYMEDVSLLGNNTKLDISVLDNGAALNKNNLDYLIDGILNFYVTETGCSNREVSLASGGYWRQDTTNSMDYPLEAAYIYFVTFFKMMDMYGDRIEYLAHWFLEPYYFENGILKDFYGNIYPDASYANKLIRVFKNYFYE